MRKRNSKGQFIKGETEPLSEEHKRKIGLANKGKEFSDEHKRNLSKALKGHKGWNKGKRFSEETRKKISEAKKGCISWMKGKKHTLEAKNKIGKASKGRIPWNKGKKCPETSGNKNPFYGKTHTEETKERLRKANKGKHRSPKTEFKKGMKPETHPHWQGGISFEPYGLEFNNKLKEQIRKRDNHTCQECYKIQKELKYKLSIHHIDYNKQNNNPNNLISLCKKCHAKTNFKRDDWTKYFKQKLWQH